VAFNSEQLYAPSLVGETVEVTFAASGGAEVQLTLIDLPANYVGPPTINPVGFSPGLFVLCAEEDCLILQGSPDVTLVGAQSVFLLKANVYFPCSVDSNLNNTLVVVGDGAMGGLLRATINNRLTRQGPA
jgi:hypothetical protein